MKHVFFTIVGLLLSLSILAQKPIKRDFPIGTLGVATRTEVVQNMLANGASIVNYSDSIIVFEGNFPTAECNMNACLVAFIDGKLFSIALSDTIGIQHPENFANLEKGVKADYGQTGKDGMEDFMVGMMILQMKAQADSTVNVDIWSRVDDKTIFFLSKGEHTFGIIYIDRDAMISRFASTMAETKGGVGSDYDESNAVKSVAGINFGGAKTDVRAQLLRKFGSPINENEHEITFSNVVVGDQNYDIAIFSFAYNKETKRQEFVSANFQRSFYSWEDDVACATFDAVASMYARKYTNENKKKDDPKEKFYVYGMLEDDYFPIGISLEKSVSRGGDMRWYVVVNYFAYKRANLYDDEI